MDVNEELKFFVKIQKMGVGCPGEVRVAGRGQGSGWGGQGGYE